jgi:hypothetical protein
MEIGAQATNCYGQMQTLESVDRSLRTLLSIAETVRRLNAAGEAAKLFKQTSVPGAWVLTDDAAHKMHVSVKSSYCRSPCDV